MLATSSAGGLAGWNTSGRTSGNDPLPGAHTIGSDAEDMLDPANAKITHAKDLANKPPSTRGSVPTPRIHVSQCR
jgi:hypothetical protein